MPCFGDTDSFSSVSSNTFSVGDEFRMEEDMLDGLGDNDDGGGISVHIKGLDGVDIAAGDSSQGKLSVVMPEMINKAVWHIRMAKAWRHFLRDSVTAANLDTNINVTHYDKLYVFICDYAQNIELPFLGDQQPGGLTALLPKVSMSLEWWIWLINIMMLFNRYVSTCTPMCIQKRRMIRVATMLLLSE